MKLDRRLAVLAVFALGCASSFTRGPDAGEDDAAADADVPTEADAGSALPPGVASCERAVSTQDAVGCTAPDTTSYCGVERCCSYSASCDGATLVPNAPNCFGTTEEACALAAPNTGLEVSWGDADFRLSHAYVDHGVGFALYSRITFTTNGAADPCTAQRLTVSPNGDFLDAETQAVSLGEHRVVVQLVDESATPRIRFATGRLVITDSSPSYGPISGTLEVVDDDVTVSGEFTEVAECVPWRSSGS